MESGLDTFSFVKWLELSLALWPQQEGDGCAVMRQQRGFAGQWDSAGAALPWHLSQTTLSEGAALLGCQPELGVEN